MVGLYEELEALAAALDAARVDYALCGALALAVHGHPRATRDIDVVIRPEDLPNARTVARSCGFTLDALPMSFAATGVTLERVSKVVGHDVLMLDLLLVNDTLRPVWESRHRVPFGAGTLPVVSRAALISMKLAAGRPQDLADLARLQESA